MTLTVETGRAGTAAPVCQTLAPAWVAGVADLLAALVAAGEERFFHPHPFDHATLRRLAVATPSGDEYHVAVTRSRVVAYGLLRGWGEGFAVPSLGLAVHPAARGAGVARRMMAHLHAVARRRGANRVRLTVVRGNRPAVVLYESLGYRLEALDERRLVGVVDLEHRAEEQAA